MKAGKLYYTGMILIFTLTTHSVYAADSFQYVSPKPGSILNSRETNVILRPGAKIDAASLHPSMINIIGSQGGAHSGDLILSDDDKTIIFIPHQKFSPNEQVTVTLKSGIKTVEGEDVLPVSFSFTITPLKDPIRPDLSDYDGYNYQNLNNSQAKSEGRRYQPANGDTLPADFPQFIITGSGETAPGLLFGSNNSDVDTIGSYSMIIDDSGTPLYYEPRVGGGFNLQPNGLISYPKALGPKHQHIYMIKDENYALIDSFQMGNGYIADSHGFILLPNGHAIMLAYDRQPIDMSQIVEGGQPDAQITGSIIQELDVDKNVVYQWRCWDYIPITDSYVDLTRSRFDYIHVNSVELDIDGNIILSCRETWDVIKISRVTGDVIWRMGGKQNEFTFINEHEENAPNYFKLQHSVRRLPNGNITIFDNGADKRNPERTYSRAVEYALDEENKTANMVWEYRHNPDILALTGGTVQRLSNGNTLISWGGAIADGAPAVTEVTPDGTTAFELSYTVTGIKGGFTRHPWYDSNVVTSVTHYIVMEGNTYEFNEGDSILTGTSIEINSFTGEDYNELIVTKTNYGPVNPQFAERAPMVLPTRVVVSEAFITTINATISFDADIFGITNPYAVKIYYREFEGSGFFVPLETSYNPATKQFSTTMTNFGEFIFGDPDFNSVAYAPKLLSPADSVSVNQTLPVEFSWAPVGYFNKFHLQVSLDEQFTNMVVDKENILSTAFTLDTVNNDESYYWRIRSINDSGESNWSKTYMFITTGPIIDVITPNGGEEYQRGFEYFIRWDDNILEDVVIELYKNDESAGIIDTTASNGVYEWEVDYQLETGTDYFIGIKSVKVDTLLDMSDASFSVIDTIAASIEKEFNRIEKFTLDQNYPNPFNPSTVISWQLTDSRHVDLSVYNILGEKVATLISEKQHAGQYQYEWRAIDMPSGIYYYQIKAGDFHDVKKMILIK